MRSKILVILDAGHGGMKNGVYTTAPAKMHKFEDGLTAYEGVINRSVCKLVQNGLTDLDIDWTVVHDDDEDTPLGQRVKLANAIYKNDGRAVYVSIHSNAGGGSGNEVFVHTKASTRSREMAIIFCQEYMKLPYPFRKGPKIYKEANYQVLRETLCPSVLLESLFFDSRKDAEFLLSNAGQQDIASTIVRAAERINK